LEAIPVISSTSALRTTVGKTESFGHYVPKDGAVQPARLLTNINPEYPAEAKRDGLSGSVELHFKIGITGDVHDINVVKGPLVLAQAAVEAVRGRRYKPARVDGVPAETDASAVFDFKLN
jgi:protein TonB